MIGTHWTILTASLSLGGMVSMGLNHYLTVEEKVAEPQKQDTQRIQELAFQQRLALAEANMRQEFEREKAGLVNHIQQVNSNLDELKSLQASQQTQLAKMAKDQAHLEFKVEIHDESFRPLRTGAERLHRMDPAAETHPLLPPVEQSWSGY